MLKSLTKAREILALPKVTINIWGNEDSYRIYRSFTKRHPRYKVIRNKCVGVALLSVPETFEGYLSGADKKSLRSRRRRSEKCEYRFDALDPLKHLEEILTINESMDARQNQPMASSYLSIEELRNHFSNYKNIFGIFDKSDTLKAYAAIDICGEVCKTNRILGHGEALQDGIMYFLWSEVVREIINMNQAEGNPIWFMYDTYFGCTQGLQIFKNNLGFNPYNVKWNWIHQ